MLPTVKVKCFATSATEDTLSMLSGHISHHEGFKSEVQLCPLYGRNFRSETKQRMNGGQVFLTFVRGRQLGAVKCLQTFPHVAADVSFVVMIFDQDGYRLWEKHFPVIPIDLAVLVANEAGQFGDVQKLTDIGVDTVRVTADFPWPGSLQQIVAEHIVQCVRAKFSNIRSHATH